MKPQSTGKKEWLQWLNEQPIPYIVRIKDNARVNGNLPVKRYWKNLSRKKLMRKSQRGRIVNFTSLADPMQLLEM